MDLANHFLYETNTIDYDLADKICSNICSNICRYIYVVIWLIAYFGRMNK